LQGGGRRFDPDRLHALLTTTRTLAVAAALALSVSACGGTEIDSGKAEKLIRDNAAAPKPQRVDCPSGVKAEKGKTFDCKLEYAGRPAATVTVHIDDSDGRVHIGPGDLQPGQ
jgi:hypothetical protein